MVEYVKEQRTQLSRAVANSGAGTRQLKGFIDNRNLIFQLRATDKAIDDASGFPRSGFQKPDKKNAYIYGLYLPDNTKCIYVGKTTQAEGARLAQHRARLNKDTLQEQKLYGPFDMTRFETATYEQRAISDKHSEGLTLLNRINALSFPKWDWFHCPKDAVNQNQANLKDVDFGLTAPAEDIEESDVDDSDVKSSEHLS